MKGNNGPCLEDTTPLCHVLSYSIDGNNGPDLLYVIISDIVSLFVIQYPFYCYCLDYNT